jgi:hypothetical protein
MGTIVVKSSNALRMNGDALDDIWRYAITGWQPVVDACYSA